MKRAGRIRNEKTNFKDINIPRSGGPGTYIKQLTVWYNKATDSINGLQVKYRISEKAEKKGTINTAGKHLKIPKGGKANIQMKDLYLEEDEFLTMVYVYMNVTMCCAF